jgi:hypothetical protein
MATGAIVLGLCGLPDGAGGGLGCKKSKQRSGLQHFDCNDFWWSTRRTGISPAPWYGKGPNQEITRTINHLQHLGSPYQEGGDLGVPDSPVAGLLWPFGSGWGCG